jgi:hypothetical protein
MNGRNHNVDETPEGRIAAVARSLAMKMEADFEKTGQGPRDPDYADYRRALAPYLRRELLLARIDEARKTAATALTTRMKELATELFECDATIAKVVGKS